MSSKEIIREELKASLKNLKEKGHDLGKEVLENVLLELSDCVDRIVTKTNNKADDFYKVVKPMIDEEIKKIHED